MALDLVEGWSERIIYQLTADGSNQVLTGITVSLLLYDRHGNLMTPSGSVGVVDAALGKVYFDPGPSDLLSSKSPYQVRWKATDISNKSAYFPQEAAEKWEVRKP